ncbi:hypothetical protein HY375_02005 [Candidatus Berkelbacteria bacterium]|nr:hypothetical protein [Candidatus Berkelbacteria bacterium]
MSLNGSAQPLPGLDMKPELDCYRSIRDRLWIDLGLYVSRVLDERMLDGLRVEMPYDGQFTKPNVASILGRFSAVWYTRSILKGIRFARPLWFKPSAVDAQPLTPEHVTSQPAEALSPTAVVPGYTGADDTYCEATITLYELGLDEDQYEERVATIALAWTLAHEIVHTVAWPEWFRADRRLNVGADTVISSRDYLLEGYRLLADLGRPFSHYASAYWSGRLIDPREDPVPFHEALAEAVTTEVLGFVVGPAAHGHGPTLEHHPFGRHPALRRWIINYLHAYPVTR